MSAKVRYRCTACGKYGHRRNTCPLWSDGEKDGPRFMDKANNSVKVLDADWLEHQTLTLDRIQKECNDILRLEELVGHHALEAESSAAGEEYSRFGVADVESDEVRSERTMKAAQDLILKMQRGEL